MKSILIFITTFNRNLLCSNLIDSLLLDNNNFKIKIIVFDDSINDRFHYNNDKVTIIYNKQHRGKENFYLTWNDMFEFCKNNTFDFYLFLQDDLKICNNFINNLINIWYSLDSPITLSPVTDNKTLLNQKSRWGDKYIEYFNEKAYKTFFVDCNMLVTKEFFNVFGYQLKPILKERWRYNKNLSSGVGQQITMFLQEKNKNMYHCTPSLCELIDTESVMNFDERKKNPLYTDIKEQISYLNKDKIIISFTTYSKRLQFAHLMVKSIIDNTFKPYKIVMTLFKDDVKYITKELQYLIDNKIVELIICDVDLRSHKKYFYTMQKYKEFPIITVDDDVIYDKNLIKKLHDSYVKDMSCICGTRGRHIKYDENGYAKMYNEYPLITNNLMGDDILFTGVGGILYPSFSFHISEKNLNDIYKYITTDDIYLYYLARTNNLKNCLVNLGVKIKNIDGTQFCSLYTNENKKKLNGLSNNDIAIEELINKRLLTNKSVSIINTSESESKKKSAINKTVHELKTNKSVPKIMPNKSKIINNENKESKIQEHNIIKERKIINDKKINFLGLEKAVSNIKPNTGSDLIMNNSSRLIKIKSRIINKQSRTSKNRVIKK